jgi:hypothetical protein
MFASLFSFETVSKCTRRAQDDAIDAGYASVFDPFTLALA